MSTDPTPPSPPPPPSAPPPRSGGSNVDFAAVPRSVWISLGGAVVLLISVFLSWYKVEFGPVSEGVSGTDATDIAWLVFLCAAVAIAVWVVELWVENVTLPFPAWQIAAGAGAVAVLLVLFRIIDKPGPDVSGTGVSIGLSFGIFLALIAAVAVVVGAYMRGQELT